MENIIDYVKEWGKYSLFEKPFNEVDSLVLCQLAYLHYGQFVPGLDRYSVPVSIRSIYEHPDREKILEGYWYRENNIELFTAAVDSKRFGGLKMNFYVDIINEHGGKLPDAIGIPEEELRKAAKMDVCKINIDSDSRLAMTAAVRKVFAEKPAEFDPRKYLGPARDNMEKLYRHKIVNVLGSAGKAE